MMIGNLSYKLINKILKCFKTILLDAFDYVTKTFHATLEMLLNKIFILNKDFCQCMTYISTE